MEQLGASIKAAKACAIDTESDGKDPRTATLLGIAFSVEQGSATFVPLVGNDLADMTKDDVLKALRRIFDHDGDFIGHNIKYDYLLLRRNGVRMKSIQFDTMLAAFQCHGDWEFFNLPHLCQRLLGKKIKSYSDVVGENQTFVDLPLSEMVNHAGQDADMTLRLYPVLIEQLKERGITAQYFGHTVPLIGHLGDLEFQGIPVNERGIDGIRDSLIERAVHLKDDVCRRLGCDCDLDSPKAVATVLRNALGHRTVAGGGTLTVAALEQLARSNPIVQMIVWYKRLRKQVAEVQSICMAITGKRIYPLFSQIKSPAGILATSDPCLLGVGALPELTACFDSSVRDCFRDKQRSLDALAHAV